jgi:hypothetical protein
MKYESAVSIRRNWPQRSKVRQAGGEVIGLHHDHEDLD